MDASNYFTSDDFDDVRGLDPWAPQPPTVAPIAPGFIRVFADVNAVRVSDPIFLALVGAGDLYLRVGTYVSKYAKGVTQTQAYVPTKGAYNQTRSTLYATGVI